MTDIINRLRRYAGELCICTPVELEAADEIERLRAKLAAAEASDAESMAMYRRAREDRDEYKSAFLRVSVELSNAIAALEGWKLVPTEPTQEMTAAMEHQWMRGSQTDMAKREYMAALAAAPEMKP